MRHNIRSAIGGVAGLAGLFLASCTPGDTATGPDPSADDAQRSIFKDDPAQQGDLPVGAETLPPLNMTLSFADGTPELTEAVRAELATILASPQVEGGGAITLRGHTDSEGPDAGNLAASRAMAEAVRNFLVEGGVAPERITVIAFGEQNPVAPNALPNGSPNEEGRAANRRVDVTVAIGNSTGREQTLVESLIETGEAGEPDKLGTKAQPQ